MPPMIAIPLLFVAAGGIIYLIRQRGSGGSAMDFAAADAHTQSTTTQTTHTQTTQTGSGTGPTPTITPPGGQPTGQSVVTPPTATEGILTIQLVMPETQPKMPSSDSLAQAFGLAPQLDTALKANKLGKEFVRPQNAPKDPALVALVKRFQGLANLTVDGYYGPLTAGALMHFLAGAPPPPPFVYSTSNPRVIKIYQPRP